MDLAAESTCSILLPKNEVTHPLDDELSKLAPTSKWQWINEKLEVEPVLPENTETIFMIADSSQDPADQIELTKDALPLNDLTLARIFTVVHCGLAESHPEIVSWYQGCIHFSDVVLLNRRDQVSQKWIKEFLDGFRQEHFPCFFEFVKKGRVDNPPHVLDPTPRRLSLFFDEEDNLFADTEEEDDDEADFDESKEDPYLARYPSGHRCKALPEIGSILSEITKHSSRLKSI